MQNTSNKKITVSILCLAYNQEKYIRQALDSFIMQKTKFNFEVLIHDDASTDMTQKIIKEFQKLHPEIIKPIYQKHNQYSKGVRITAKYQLPRAQGRYIALCEGDDYWTDPNKLQVQVDYMEKNKNKALSFHSVRVFFENKQEKDTIYPKEKTGFTTAELLRRNFIQTNSVMYRRQSYNKLATNVLPGDWYLHLYHAQFGEIGFIDRVMSAYRRHEKGIWWDSHKNRDGIWRKFGINHINLYLSLLDIYGDDPEYEKILNQNIFDAVASISAIDSKDESNLLEEVSTKYPEAMIKFGSLCTDENKKLTTIAKERKNVIDHYVKALEIANRRAEELEQELNKINSNIIFRVTRRLGEHYAVFLSKFKS